MGVVLPHLGIESIQRCSNWSVQGRRRGWPASRTGDSVLLARAVWQLPPFWPLRRQRQLTTFDRIDCQAGSNFHRKKKSQHKARRTGDADSKAVGPAVPSTSTSTSSSSQSRTSSSTTTTTTSGSGLETEGSQPAGQTAVLARTLPPPVLQQRPIRRRKRQVWLVMAVAVALINKEGLVLMAQRPPNKHFGSTWEFPGGKMEAYETPEQAAAREMLEEVGVVIEPQDLAPLTFASHSYANGQTHLLLPLFVCRKWEGEARGCEGQQISWVSSNELDGVPMPPADVSLIPAVKDAILDSLAGGNGTHVGDASAPG